LHVAGIGTIKKTPFKGVGWIKHLAKWYSRCEINGQRKCLGNYDTAEEAAAAYDRCVMCVRRNSAACHADCGR